MLFLFFEFIQQTTTNYKMSEVASNQSPSADPNRASGLWDRVKAQGKKAGKIAQTKAHQTKLRAEMIMIDQKVNKRKQSFGVELYDTLVLQAEQDPTFIIDGETLENIRGQFVTAFKDNKALLQKKAKQQQALVEIEEKKAIAFPKEPAETIGEQMKNAGIAANFKRQDVTCRTRIARLEADMKENKKKFGVETYHLLEYLEDHKKWLSPDRDVRFLYDAARRDITQLQKDKQQKLLDLNALGQQQV